jgi:CRISPR-associated protein Cas1
LDQILDISSEGRHLSRDRGFLKVEHEKQTVGIVPLDQITAVIVHAHGATYSNSLLVELADRGIPLVICAANHHPRAVILPLEGYHAQGARMRAQLSAPLPMLKQAWKQVVICKIKMQAAALNALSLPDAPLLMMVRKVQSGDFHNVEAQAARYYWPMIMGKAFRRDRSLGDVNSLLNYGYTILRSTAARAIVGAGLHPTMGIFHSNRGNAFALADDLMEPFRPLVDLTARSIMLNAGHEVTPEAKQALTRLIALDLPLTGDTSPVSVAVSRLAISLAQSFETKILKLALPNAPEPFVLAGLGK